MIEQATQWLSSQLPSMERLLRDLVEASSWTYDKAGNDAATAILRAAVPLRCESIPSERFGDHSVFHAGRAAAQGGVILVGHIDTVFPRDKFAGYRSDGKIARGPGVLDMKGGLVTVAFALQALKQLGLLDRAALSFAVVSDEEVGSPDSAPHVRRVATGAKASLVFESGRAGDAIITRRKGTGSLTAVATGRAAHAGNSHKEGANAIWAISRFVDRLQGITDYDRGTTINVGKISGGIGKNTVPDRAEALVDLRYVSQAESDAMRARIAEAARDTGVAGTSIELQWGPGRGPMEKTPASDALRAAYAECQRDAGLGTGETGLVGGGSDAATTSAIGIPSIDGLGPRGSGFHTLDEYVELESFVPKAQALVRYLLKNAVTAAMAAALLLGSAAAEASSEEPAPLAPGCRIAISTELKAASDRPGARTRDGSCAATEEAERVRQLNQAKLDCLMNGYEDARDLKMTCIPVLARTAAGKKRQLHFEFKWRCSKTVCAQ